VNRSNITAILGDIDDTMARVRDLSTSPERAAALQCLADARRHLARALAVQLKSDPDCPRDMSVESVERCLSGPRVVSASVPPSATDNQRVRTEAGERFRESRRILRGVLSTRDIAEREHEKLLEEQATGRRK